MILWADYYKWIMTKRYQGDFNMPYFDERLKELHRQKAQKNRLEAMKAELLK